MKYLFADTETFCKTPIASGLYRYSENVEVMIFAYAVDDEPVSVIDLTAGERIPARIISALTDPEYTKVFHNAQFDRTVIKSALGIEIPVTQIHCTMIQALAHALPAGLGQLCDVFSLPFDVAKDKAGKQLINLFCKPRGKNVKIRRATRETHPEDWQKFIDYAGNDITSMRLLFGKMPMWNYRGFERQLWELDQRINDRGFAVDVELAERAIEAVEIAQAGLAERTQEVTFDDVQSANQRDKMLHHILEYYGVKLADMQKANIERRLDDPDLPWAVKELLAIRLETSVTSTAKYKKLLKAVSYDGRLRGTIQFDGASRTRRAAGRTFQPQNLPRPTHSQAEIDEGIKAIKIGAADLITDNVMSLTSSCIRGCIVAGEGNILRVSDLSNIEGRVAAWITNEDWKLKAFADFDAGVGHDLYILTYARAFNVDPDSVDKEKRQLGKVQELALGYGGGVGAFVTFALTYKMDLQDLADKAKAAIPDDIMREAIGMWDWTVRSKRSTLGLEKDIWVVCDALKRMWRNSHPNFVDGWDKLEICARKAIANPDKQFTYNRLVFVRKGAWLRIILPSGACLCYPAPRVERNQITYAGVNQYSRKWTRIKTYGGKLFENICQSVARDVLFDAMPRCEAEGYKIVLHVHDELLTETPNTNQYSEKRLSEIIATNPVWAPGLPLAAGGFESTRYKK